MRRQITFSVIADGGTDRTLIPILQWALHRLDPDVDILEPDFCKRQGTVAEFIQQYESHSMLIFVHRDAERSSLEERRNEFINVIRAEVVPVIPVRMTEAWLLIDAYAIARAADRPDAVVSLPPVRQLENVADPKQLLEDLLMEAAGDLAGRRLTRFKASLTERRVNVASLISDFGALEELPAFQSFQAALSAAYPYRG